MCLFVLLVWALGVATRVTSGTSGSLGDMMMATMACVITLCEAFGKATSLQWPILMLVGLLAWTYNKVGHKSDEPTIGLSSGCEIGVSSWCTVRA